MSLGSVSRAPQPIVTMPETRARQILWLDANTGYINVGDDRYYIARGAHGAWLCSCPFGTTRITKLCTHVIAALEANWQPVPKPGTLV